MNWCPMGIVSIMFHESTLRICTILWLQLVIKYCVLKGTWPVQDIEVVSQIRPIGAGSVSKTRYQFCISIINSTV